MLIPFLKGEGRFYSYTLDSLPALIPSEEASNRNPQPIVWLRRGILGGFVMTMLRVISLASVALAASILGASAQTYPNQTVRIVVPFSAGSITDGLARILADKLAEMWKQQV